MAAAERRISAGLGAELDAALAAIGGFEPRPLLAVGVSGGPDSLALIILADRWARARGGVAWGLVVDHRLRPESTAEARQVAGWLAARGIPHAGLVWREEKPATRIQERAREARYRLLAEWCAEHGCIHLMTAHHSDDQVETYLIRRRAQSGIDGLAGMSAVRELRGLRLVRPLLAVPKARLIAFLAAEGQDYVEDPSNRNPAFERARLRLEAERENVEPVITTIRANADARIAREKELAALLARAVALHPGGFALIEPETIAAAGEVGERALARVVTVLGGAPYPVRRERLRRLREALAETPRRARTLGGCRFVPWRGRVLALREASRVAAPVTVAPGGSVLWDRRFLATLSVAARGARGVGALGSAAAPAPGRIPAGRDKPLPRLVYPMLPAMWDEAGAIEAPHLSPCGTTVGCLVSLRFRPAVSLFGAGFTVV